MKVKMCRWSDFHGEMCHLLVCFLFVCHHYCGCCVFFCCKKPQCSVGPNCKATTIIQMDWWLPFALWCLLKVVQSEPLPGMVMNHDESMYSHSMLSVYVSSMKGNDQNPKVVIVKCCFFKAQGWLYSTTRSASMVQARLFRWIGGANKVSSFKLKILDVATLTLPW